MADIIKSYNDVHRRNVDMLDGTYAERVVITTGPGGTSPDGTRILVEPLGIPGVARQLAAGSSSANTVLTVGVGRVSIHARGADIRYVVGSSAQTASATSHYIASGERLDIDVPATPNIAVIRAGSVDGTLELTELA